MTATPKLMLNWKWYQASKPEMEFHMIDIIYAALSIRAQTEKTTFSCIDDCTLMKHTRCWTYFARDFEIPLCQIPQIRVPHIWNYFLFMWVSTYWQYSHPYFAFNSSQIKPYPVAKWWYYYCTAPYHGMYLVTYFLLLTTGGRFIISEWEEISDDKY